MPLSTSNANFTSKQNGLEDEVEKKIKEHFKKKGVKRPSYNGDLPKGNDGLGLMLLGITGDQVLPKEVYEKIKAQALIASKGYGAG